MKNLSQSKEYKAPHFQLVKQDEQNNVFFAASGPALTSVGGALGSMTSTNSSW